MTMERYQHTSIYLIPINAIIVVYFNSKHILTPMIQYFSYYNEHYWFVPPILISIYPTITIYLAFNSFLPLWSSIWDQYPPPWGTSEFSCDELFFIWSKMFLMNPYFWNMHFPGFIILHWQLFCCIVFFFPSYLLKSQPAVHLFDDSFWMFCLSSAYSNFTMMGVAVNFFCLWSSMDFWNMWPITLPHCRKFLTMISSNIASAQFPLSFLSRILITCVIKIDFVIFILHTFCLFFFFLSLQLCFTPVFILDIFFWPNF